MFRPLSILAILAILPSCTMERTVYDEYGNPVEESEPGKEKKEKELASVMESRFNASFSEHKNKEGVPETASSKVSRYQKDIDAARSGGKTFYTNSYNGFNARSDIRDQRFDSSGSAPISRDSRFDTSGSTGIRRDLRPDFMNSSRGLAHSSYTGATGRSTMEGRTSDAAGQAYGDTHASQYKAHTPSSYVSSREAKTPQPVIMDHRQPGKRPASSIEQTRRLLGRDETSR